MREAVFAYQGWYPSDPGDLRDFLGRAIDPRDEAVAEHCLGVMCPHAGYRYSGRIAGSVYGRVVVPDRVVVLSVNHRGYGKPGAVWTRGHWEIPGAVVAVDAELADSLLARSDLLRSDTVAHRYEHSGELQVPFLHARNAAVRIVPVALRHLGVDEAIALGRSIADAIRALGEPVLIVASSDMNHYESADETVRKDEVALERLAALDPRGLYRVVADQGITMCGVVPTVVMLQAAITLGATRARIVAHSHSGAVTGENEQVVGYAGALVW